jgi:hypothetical protein
MSTLSVLTEHCYIGTSFCDIIIRRVPVHFLRTQAERLVLESLESTEHLDSSPSFTHTKTPNDAHFIYKVP